MNGEKKKKKTETEKYIIMKLNIKQKIVFIWPDQLSEECYTYFTEIKCLTN